MSNKSVRLRFAPSPTGIMHLGNIRTALLNYLFAKQKDGVFLLRIEDTDPARNFDPGGKKIQEDLHWLNLIWDEGPTIEGPYAPYMQSQRFDIYSEKLNELKDKGFIYRCFCTTEILNKKRQRQIALKQPPRYDRTCAKLSEDEIQKNLDEGIPFIWRFKIDHGKQVTFEDLARGTMKFDAANFSDFPVSRADGSPTFMFANAVDDMMMEISYVLRGEDHLTNTVGQVLLYNAFDVPTPTYWHVPILCNTDGKKLSKRDFGFSLDDLTKEGYTHEAIVNYLAIIGGSYENEVMDLDELIKAMKFDNLHHGGHITYDVNKLNWLNHKWIDRLEIADLAQRCKPFLEDAFPQVKDLSKDQLEKLIGTVQTDITTLKDAVEALRFYFEQPSITQSKLDECVTSSNKAAIKNIIDSNIPKLSDGNTFADAIKADGKAQSLPLKELFWSTRLGLTGKCQGLGIAILVDVLGEQESKKRLQKLNSLLR